MSPIFFFICTSSDRSVSPQLSSCSRFNPGTDCDQDWRQTFSILALFTNLLFKLCHTLLLCLVHLIVLTIPLNSLVGNLQVCDYQLPKVWGLGVLAQHHGHLKVDAFSDFVHCVPWKAMGNGTVLQVLGTCNVTVILNVTLLTDSY